MHDQAESLRRQVNQNQQTEAKVVAVVSGKGGVGKSNVSLNFAIALAQKGKKVTIVDLDIGMGNLDIMLGKPTKYSIVDMLESQLTIWDIIEKGPENIQYISGGSGLTSFVKINQSLLDRFTQQLLSLSQENDFILLDLGAGVTEDSIGFILAADEMMVVTTPEPTSMTDAYSMIKFVTLKDYSKPMYLIINKIDTKEEGSQTFSNLHRVSKQFLDKELRLLGSLPNDPSVTKAVKAQKPFLIFLPHAGVSTALKTIASHYLGESSRITKTSRFAEKMKAFFRKKTFS
ncbi:putative ATPase [Bacillus sp. TS-2]|nr:putative ATPase [Bacillus sp. TS-2]